MRDGGTDEPELRESDGCDMRQGGAAGKREAGLRHRMRAKDEGKQEEESGTGGEAEVDARGCKSFTTPDHLYV